MTPMELKAELERLAEKATPGPWTHENQFTEEMADFIYGVGKGAVVCQQSDADLKYSVANWPHCAELIVSLRNNLSTILRALSALSGLESVKGALEGIEAACADPRANVGFAPTRGELEGAIEVSLSLARSALSQLDQEAAGG